MAEKTAKYARILGCVNSDVRFKCPECGQHFQGDRAGYAGFSLQCTRCGTEFTVPVVKPEPPPTGGDIPDGDFICPHCWKSFDPAALLAISVHPSLVGDPVVGEFEQKRFEPLVFDVDGIPLDACGLPSPDAACPYCHLRIPRAMLDLPERYYSIVGAPSAGKSYFLTTLIHRLKTLLPERFDMALVDADPVMNSTLNSYEKTLFMPLEPDKVVSLPKTQPTGDAFSDRIRQAEMTVELPKPFVFECRSPQNDFNLVFYDNAGEQFEPGVDGAANPATRHLSRSDGIIFVFDPTHDAVMRACCDRSDPQTVENAKVTDQSELLAEMVGRIRKLSNLGSMGKSPIPLIILVAKYDAWKTNSSLTLPENGLLAAANDGAVDRLNIDALATVSCAMRNMLLKFAPAVVNTAETFFDEVYILPGSSFGTPARRGDGGELGVNPSAIAPVWVEAPMLVLLHHAGVIGGVHADRPQAKPAADAAICGDRLVWRRNGKTMRLPLWYCGCAVESDGEKTILPEKEAHHA